jgi:hypothetical protein
VVCFYRRPLSHGCSVPSDVLEERQISSEYEIVRGESSGVMATGVVHKRGSREEVRPELAEL